MTSKRSENISVRISPEDVELLMKAAAKKWPDAILTKSTIVLSLARIAAKQILTQK